MQKNSNHFSNKIILLIFIGAGFFIFGNGLTGDFVHDDILVLSHSFFENHSKIFGFFGQPYFEGLPETGLYRPLTQLSFGLNYLFGSSSTGFHLANTLFHILNSFLVYILLSRLTKEHRFSLASGFLFLVLPIHVEAVTSIVGRAELLSFLFGILSLILWFDSRYLISGTMLLLAVFSKESAVAIFAILLVLNWYYKRNWRPLVWHMGALGIYFIARFAILGANSFKSQVEFIFNPLAYSSFGEKIYTAMKVLFLYVQNIFIPSDLSPDYSYDQIPIVKNLFYSPKALLGFAVFIVLVWLIWTLLKDRKGSIWQWAALFFLPHYFIISNLVFTTGTIMADRLMYFSSLGGVIILAWGIERLFKFSRKLGTFVMAALIAIYAGFIFDLNRVWSDRETLLTEIYKKSPESIAAKTNYGILMLEKDKELAKRLSIEVYEKYPDYVQNLNLRAAVEIQAGNLPEAEKFLERALELRPKHQNTLQNLSRVYFSQNKYKETEEILKVLVFEYGGTGNVIFYGLVLSKNGHLTEARQLINDFFGPEVTDDSALKILRGQFKDLEAFYKLNE